MNTASKKSLFFVLLTSLASLTACGGGGGGGGGGALPAPRPLISVSEITGGMTRQGHLAEDYSNAGDSGGLKATLENGGLTGEIDGQTLTVKHGNSIHILTSGQNIIDIEFETGPGGDVWQFGNGSEQLSIAEKEMDDWGRALLKLPPPGTILQNEKLGVMHNDPEQRPIYFSGTSIGGRQYLLLNSGLVQLEHSTFGGWAGEIIANGTLSWQNESRTGQYYEVEYVPLAGGEALKTPANNAAFTGKAVAMATQFNGNTLQSPTQTWPTNPDSSHLLMGDASLKVSNTGTTADLTLAFPNFYDIKFSDFNVDGTGSFSADATKLTVTDKGNTSPFRYPASINEGQGGFVEAELSGGFYGAAGDTSASEAAGVFGIYAKNTKFDDEFKIVGSFGVKQ